MKYKKTQKDNKEWWEKNPMSYEGWEWSGFKPIKCDENKHEFYDEIDKRFFYAAKHFANPNKKVPFSDLIDFNSLKDKCVLEIGCGIGSHAELFAKAHTNFTAIDITENAVLRTKKRFELKNLKGKILQMDAAKMCFPDNYFDFVWSWGVIHH